MSWFTPAKLTREETQKMSGWISVAINLIAPGALYLYFYQTEQFLSLETGKLVFLSIILSIPVFIISLLCAFIADEDKEKSLRTMHFLSSSLNSILLVIFWIFFTGLKEIEKYWIFSSGYMGLIAFSAAILLTLVLLGKVTKRRGKS